ncbi:mucin-17-like isoform X2 [Dermacentor albipictus]|uniref:mucin-17-like isoform X2 n=1 Tax=Dermacentor albipictus TaxID=60249 RepID=UPI0031FDEE76
MSRRLSSQEASEATGAEPLRGRSSRGSLGYPNSSLSPWYISNRNGVSLGSMTITSPCQPLSVSGSVSGISYPTSVSSSIIPRTQTRLVAASASGGGRLVRGGGADSMPRVCRPLRVGTDTAIPGSEQLLQVSVRVVPSHGRLAQSRSSSCGGGHAFLRPTSRVSVRVGPRTSNPVIAERMRIVDNLMRQASAGRRATKRALSVPAEASDSAERAALPSAARTIEFEHLDVTPRVFTSVQTDVNRSQGVIPTRSTSSHEEVGRMLFSDWANRKNEMFADVFKDRKGFFADLLKLRHDEGHEPVAHAQKVPTGNSSRSDLFMTTISEMAEKDVPETSAENYTVHSPIGLSTTARKTAIEEKVPLQAVAASEKLYPTSSEFDSYDLSRTADSKTRALEAPSDGVILEPGHVARASGGELLGGLEISPQELTSPQESEGPAADENLTQRETAKESELTGFEHARGGALLGGLEISPQELTSPQEFEGAAAAENLTQRETAKESELTGFEHARGGELLGGLEISPQELTSPQESEGAAADENLTQRETAKKSELTGFEHTRGGELLGGLEISPQELTSPQEFEGAAADENLTQRATAKESELTGMVPRLEYQGGGLVSSERTEVVEVSPREMTDIAESVDDYVTTAGGENSGKSYKSVASERSTVADSAALQEPEHIKLMQPSAASDIEANFLTKQEEKASNVTERNGVTTPKTESEVKMEIQLELVPSEQQFQDNKVMEVTQVSPLWSIEAASARAEVPTEASGYGYVPALADSTFEAPGATSEEHQVMPTSLEGPFVSMASDMTDFPALDLSRTQEPDVSRQLPSLREPDHSEVQTQLVERPQTDDSAQLQVTGNSHQLGASGARPATRGYETLVPIEQAPMSDVSATQNVDDALLQQSGAPAADENLTIKEAAKANELRDIVPRQEDQGSEPASSESSAVVEMKETEKHDGIPFNELSTEPTDEEFLGGRDLKKTLYIPRPPQQGEIVSTEPTPLSDVSATTQRTDDALQSSASLSKVVPGETLVPLQLDELPDSRVKEIILEPGHVARASGGELLGGLEISPQELTSPQESEGAAADENLTQRETAKESELTGFEHARGGALLGGLEMSPQELTSPQEFEGAAADENLTQRETAKESELTGMVPRLEYQGGGLVSSERTEVVEVSPREMTDIAESVDDYVTTAGGENFGKSYKSVSSERSTVADSAALQEPEHIELMQPSAASDIGANFLTKQEEKASNVTDLVARDKEEISEMVSSYARGLVEASAMDKPVAKEQQVETSLVPVPVEEIHANTSSMTLEPADASAVKGLSRRPLTEPNDISAADDHALMKLTEKVSEVRDMVASQPDESSDLVPSEDTQAASVKETEVIVPSTLETSQTFPVIEYISAPVAETSDQATASKAAPPGQMLMTKTGEYSTDASAEAILKENEQPAAQGPVDYAAQFWDSETMQLALTNMWTPESGTVLAEDASRGRNVVDVMDVPEVQTVTSLDGPFIHSEPERTSMEALGSGAVFVGEAMSGSTGTARDTAEAVKETSAPTDENVVDYAAQFWDSEAIKLQLTNMWTPEGGAVVVEDIQADIMVPDHVAALSDQYPVVETQPTSSSASLSKEVPGETLVPLQSNELTDLPVKEIILEPGYFQHGRGGELLGGLEIRPQEATEETERAESGDIEALPDERPITSGQESGMVHIGLEGEEATDAPSGGVVAISADMGALPQPALPTLLEHPEHPGCKEGAIEEYAESAVAEVVPSGRPTAISGQKDALGLELPSKETEGEPMTSAEAEMSAVNVIPELTWSVSSDRPTEHPEREPEATEETTAAAAESDFTDQQPNKAEQIKRTAGDQVGDKFDRTVNEERGPLLAITRMEKHSCEKTSERILKRYGDTGPMESVTGAHESFVIAETETQLFGAEARDSSMRNAPEKARTEAECSQSKFEPDVFLADLFGKSSIESTEPSQPCDYIARPLNIFDDVAGAAATSTTEAVTGKQSPLEDAVIQRGSEGTKESSPYCPEKQAVDYDNAPDHINLVGEASGGASPSFSPKGSPLATYSPFPEAEFASLTSQGQYVPRPTFDLENKSTKLQAYTKESDFAIKTAGASQYQSSLNAKSNSSVDKLLQTLHKPPLRLSGGLFQQQLVNVNALSVPLGKCAFTDAVLPYSVYKSPFHSMSSASELDSTKYEDGCQKMREIPENPSGPSSAKPTGEMQADAAYVSLTENNVDTSPLADEGEEMPNCDATLNKKETGFQLDAAAYQQAPPKVEDIALIEAQDQYGHSETALSTQRTDLKPVSLPFDETKVHDDDGQPLADCVSLSCAENLQALSDEQAKLRSANMSLQAAFAPLKIGTPPLGTPPLATPPVETSPALTPITGTSMFEPPATSDGQYTTPFKTVTGQEPSEDHTEPVCAAEYIGQARSTDREPCNSADNTTPSVPIPYETGVTKCEATNYSGQARHQLPLFSFTEDKQPFSVARKDSNPLGFAADLHKWFRTEDTATAEYPISVQAESTEDDSSGIEFPPWPSHSETEPEKAFHAVDLPAAAPDKEGAKKNLAVPSLLQELEGTFVCDPTEKDNGVENTRECVHTGSVSGIDQGSVAASLNSIPAHAEPQKSGLAIAAEIDGAGKTKIQKRRLSFSDEVTASNDAAFREKNKLLVGYSDVGSRADALASENVARSPRNQATYIYLAGATIPEEEYSRDKHELSSALDSDTSDKAGDEELKRPYNARQSVPDDDWNNDEHSAGSAFQHGEFSASTSVQSAPKDVTAATNATWRAGNRDDDLQRPLYAETGFEDARRLVNKSWLSLRTGSADYSSENVENTRGDVTALGDRRAIATEVGDNTWETSTRDFDSNAPTGAATSDPLGTGGVPSSERKGSLSSVSVGYTQESHPNDGNVSSYSVDASDDMESLKVRLFATRRRSQVPGDIPDDVIRKSEPTSTLSASHVVATDAPFPWEHTRSVDSETGYAPATILRDDAYQMSLPGSAVAEGAADVANASEHEVPKAGKETTKSESALSPAFGNVLNAEEGPTRHGEEQPDAGMTARAAPIQLEPSQRGGSESPTSDDEEGRMEHLLKEAGEDRKDDAQDISQEVPDADDESPKLASHCEELRFENFRTVVERMADLSTRSEANIVYESFVPAIGKASDMLDNVYYGTAFKVRVVDDYDLPSIMYDRWNEDAASVAPTIKTFWTYSPHSFLVSVDENDRQVQEADVRVAAELRQKHARLRSQAVLEDDAARGPHLVPRGAPRRGSVRLRGPPERHARRARRALAGGRRRGRGGPPAAQPAGRLVDVPPARRLDGAVRAQPRVGRAPSAPGHQRLPAVDARLQPAGAVPPVQEHRGAHLHMNVTHFNFDFSLMLRMRGEISVFICYWLLAMKLLYARILWCAAALDCTCTRQLLTAIYHTCRGCSVAMVMGR